MSKKRAKRIRVVLFDVDGTLTDGRLFFIPRDGEADASHSSFSAAGQIEVKGFHAHDGAGFSLARLGGLKTGIITRRNSETVGLRAKDLKMDFIHQGIQDKLQCLSEICTTAGVTTEEVAFVGDDVIDIPIMQACGFAIAVANSREEVLKEAHHVTRHGGGEGGARDAIEHILKAQGTYKRVVAEYVKQSTQPAKGKKALPQKKSK